MGHVEPALASPMPPKSVTAQKMLTAPHVPVEPSAICAIQAITVKPMAVSRAALPARLVAILVSPPPAIHAQLTTYSYQMDRAKPVLALPMPLIPVIAPLTASVLAVLTEQHVLLV